MHLIGLKCALCQLYIRAPEIILFNSSSRPIIVERFEEESAVEKSLSISVTLLAVSPVARRCGHPGDTPNGQREGNVFVYPNRVKYTCVEGYELVGKPYRVCAADGQWSGTLPMCRRKSNMFCGRLS